MSEAERVEYELGRLLNPPARAGGLGQVQWESWSTALLTDTHLRDTISQVNPQSAPTGLRFRNLTQRLWVTPYRKREAMIVLTELAIVKPAWANGTFLHTGPQPHCSVQKGPLHVYDGTLAPAGCSFSSRCDLWPICGFILKILLRSGFCFPHTPNLLPHASLTPAESPLVRCSFPQQFHILLLCDLISEWWWQTPCAP